MKKTLSFLALLLLLSTLSPVLASAKVIPMSLRVVVDNQKITFPDAQPFEDANKRVQVPVRFVSEALKAKVTWDAKAKSADIVLDDKEILITIGQKTYTVNGQAQTMDTAALFKDNRTYVPIRFVSQALGATVLYDSAVNTVYITTGSAPVEKPKETQNKVVKKEYSGFTVYHDPDTLYNEVELQIEGDDDYKRLGKDYAVILLMITFDHPNSDYDKEVVQVETILRQQINSDVVDSIMKYVKQKTKYDQELPLKKFMDKEYFVYVGSKEHSELTLTVYKR